MPAREMRMTTMTILSISSAIVRAHPPSPGIRHLLAHRPAMPGMTMLMIFFIFDGFFYICFHFFLYVSCVFLYLSPGRAGDDDAGGDDDNEDVDEKNTDGEGKKYDSDDGDACLFERWPR